MSDLLNMEFEKGFCKIGAQYSPQQLKQFSEQLRILNLQKEGKLHSQVNDNKPELKSGFTKI